MRFFSLVKGFIAVTMIVSLAGESLAAETSSLEDRLAELEQQVAILKRQIENQKEDTTTKSKETPVIVANAKEGFVIKSPDESYKLKVGGYVQADSRNFLDNKKSGDLGYNSKILARRVRPTFSGTVARDFDYNIQTEFGGSSPAIVDAYAEYKYWPAFKIRGGKFKTPFSLEYLQSTPVTNFAELGLTGNLAPNRDIGFQVSGDLLKERLSYAVGYFDGAGDRENLNDDPNNGKDFAGRIFLQPFKNTAWEDFKGLGFGYAYTYGRREGSLSQSYISPGQATIFTYGSPSVPGGAATTITANGPQLRTSPQLYYYWHNIGLLGEYVTSQQLLTRSSGAIRDKFENTAWQISGNYVLTGELASYKGIAPRNDFDPSKGTWGAFEVVGRYGQLKFDDKIFDQGFASLNTSVSQASAWAAGLNWYLNRNAKLLFDFERTEYKRGAINDGNRKPENVVTSRVQLSF